MAVGWCWWAVDGELMDRAEQHGLERLAATRDDAADALGGWVGGVRHEAEYWASRAVVIDAVTELSSLPGDQLGTARAQAVLRERLVPYLDSTGLDGYAVIRPDGVTLARSRDELLGERHELARKLPVDFGAMLAGSTTLSDVLADGEKLAEGTGERDPAGMALYVGAPVRRAGEVVGVLALRLPVADELAAVVRERTFGDTGVVLIVARDGDLVATSTDRDAPRSSWRPATEDPWSEVGTAVHNDHSGYPVVSAWRWLPDLGMGVVAEQRRSETLALGSYAAKLLAVLSGVVGVLVTMVWLVPQVSEARMRRERRRWLDDQTRIMRAVAATERRYRALVDPSPDAVLLVDRRGVVLDANPAAASHFGARRATMVGEPIDVLGLDDRSARQVAETLERVVLLGEPAEIDRVRWAPSGRPAGWFRLRAVPDLSGGKDDPHVHLVLSDISELVEHQERLAALALVDPLTGLANRLAILDRIERATSVVRSPSRGVGVLMVDLDRFKALNDTYGHHVGDEGLCAVARSLATLVDPTTVGRIGGDEFIMVVEDTDEQAGLELAHRTAELLGTVEITVGSRRVKVGGSVGYAFTAKPVGARELMIRADRALRDAKVHRSGKVRSYGRTGTGPPFHSNADMLAELHTAVEEQQFVLRYQPIAEPSGRTSAVEALLRWRHPDHGLLLPDVFLPALLETGLLHAVGRWVVSEASHQIVRWHDAGRATVPVHVNLAPAELSYDELFETVRVAVDRVRSVGGELCFEITEEVLGVGMSPEGLAALWAFDVPIVLDDFGTGASSLSHLRHECLAGIKLDRSFVRNLEVPDAVSDRSILAGTIGLARELGLDVVAEGVETEAQAAWLVERGCSRMQGWRFGVAARGEDVDLPERTPPADPSGRRG